MFFPFAMFYFVQAFVAYNGVIRNQSIWDKRTLRWGYDMVEDMFESICHCFGYNPIDYIAKANGSKVCQNNVCVI